MRQTKKMVAAVLAGIMACSGLTTGYAGAIPDCDETLYITLGHEGEIEESSVVKRYAVHEDGTVTDYGTYEKISNLTTMAEPVKNSDGSYTFPVNAADGAFYFEGITQTSKEELPWNIEVTYLLNGVETAPEQLAGKSGLVEIQADLTPNKGVSAYMRNNMALTMAALVNTDEMLSLRADGAQLQTIGNMSAVVFFALPGEECHYTIAIGSDDFEFSGLMFLMVPLTMQQLEHVGDLKEAKKTLEDSKNALSDSLDVILDTMEQMQGGISDTAAGLRGLDSARQVIHAGKDSVYDQADQALEQLDALAESLRPFQQHTDNAQEALRSIRLRVSEMTANINELEPKLGDLKDTVQYLRNDISMIQDTLNSPEMDYASATFMQLLEKTKQDILKLSQSQAAMSQSIGNLGELMAGLEAGGASLEESAALLAALDLDTDYDPEELEELVLMLQDNVELVNDLPAEAGAAASGSNWSVPDAAKPALGQFIQTTTAFTGNTGIGADLAGMIELTQQVIQMLESKKGEGNAVVHESKDLLTNIGKISKTGEDICGDIDRMNQTLERYHPDALATLEDLGEMTDRTAAGIESLSRFFKTLEEQVKLAGGNLNDGTKATLNGLADVLDHAGAGLGQTDTLRNAKNTVINTIDDKWDEFSQENTTILEMDTQADPVSLTSEKNASPRSMQIIVRTKEITRGDDKEQAEVDESFQPEGNALHRIAMIFRKIWDTICSVFR